MLFVRKHRHPLVRHSDSTVLTAELPFLGQIKKLMCSVPKPALGSRNVCAFLTVVV